MTHHFHLRVYYEDTDLAGIVYYANYFKFIERARSEWLRTLDVEQSHLRSRYDIVFVVAKLEADFIKPAKFDDPLSVETKLLMVSPAKLEMQQSVFCDHDLLFRAKVVLGVTNTKGKPVRMPSRLLSLLVQERLSQIETVTAAN